MIYFLIPMYNEELNLIGLHKTLSQVLPNEKKFFLFVDDNSSDHSVLVANELFERFPHHIITKPQNEGPGHSFNLGFKWITEHSKSDLDVVITMEADNTSDVSILPEMLALNTFNYELVLASVYAQGGGFEKTSFFRKLLSFGANMFLRSVYDIKILTLSSFYRVYSVKLLKRIQANYDNELILEKGFICMLEILLKAVNVKAKVIEVPMLLKSDKRQGKSKMKVFKTALSYFRFLSTYKSRKIED